MLVPHSPTFLHPWGRFLQQVKKLKAQLEQKTAQKNGTESSLSTDGDILENGTAPNLLELQRKLHG